MADAKKTIRAFVNLGMPFVGANKKLKEFAAEHGGLDLEKLKRREQYLRRYNNRGQRRGVTK